MFKIELTMKELKGTGVALVTPMKENGTTDFDGLSRLVKHVSKLDYLVVMGTTGESATHSDDEKEAILHHVIKQNKNRLPVVFGIGGNNTAVVTEKLVKFKTKGVCALLSVSPYYNKPSQEGIYQHFKAVAEASPLPLILYNVPGRTGSNMTAETSVRLSGLKKIVAIKEASGNLEQAMQVIRRARPEFMVLSGEDMLTVPMMSVGAAGVISVLANAYPNHFKKMTDAALAGDFRRAAKIQTLFGGINPLMYEEGNPSGVKEVLKQMGVCGNDCRLPVVPVSKSLSGRIHSQMEEIKKG